MNHETDVLATGCLELLLLIAGAPLMGLLAFLVVVGFIEVATTAGWVDPPVPTTSLYSDCLARCEALFDVDHRPAGWVVLDPEPCTCGVVLEVSDG